MSQPVTVPTTPATVVSPVADSSPAPPVLPSTRRPRRRTRARFWLLLLATAAVCLVLTPPPWHAALRAFLTWQAARQNCDLTIDAIEGGPLDATHLYGVHYRQRGLPTAAPAATGTGIAPLAPGTDVRVERAEITFAWTWRGRRRAASPSSWVRRLTLDGVRGRWDLSAGNGPRRKPPAPGAPLAWLDALAPRAIPAEFFLRADDATVRRGRYHLRAGGLSLSGSRDGGGRFLARAVEIGGPGFDAALPNQHGRTLWQGDRLTISDLDLGHGVRLARATLDGARLGRHRLDWDCDLRALGGTVRGQGAINFSRERLALELGGSVQQVALGPLARLMEITGPADGQVEQASFSFRGDPENWLAAEMWLAGRATDFRWGQRRWESLEMQAVLTNRRVQVHRLELRQSRNRLSLDGECSLPPDPLAAAAAGRWWQAGFACNVDARLEDLHDLAQLVGPGTVPAMAGRMSVNGRLGARPGTQGYDGYLNVEGSGLTVRGAPLDFLRSTLLFRGEEVVVADLQATRGGDYLTGRGSVHIAGAPNFQALGRVSIDDLGVYAPAYEGLLPWAKDHDGGPIRALTAGVRLEGSVLHLDQCQGEQDGNTFQMSGSVDVRDAGSPLLDLTVTSQQPPRMADPADAAAAWRAGVSSTLALRGPLPGGVTIHGDARLSHGHFDDAGALNVTMPATVETTPLAARLLPPLLRRLPEAWRDWPLELHVTSSPEPMPTGESGDAGEVTLDLDITGTARAPLLGGKLAFRAAAGTEQTSGAWYFSPGQPDNPTVSITASAEAGKRGTFVYGPLAQAQTVSWTSTETGNAFLLAPDEWPPGPSGDEGALAAWTRPQSLAPPEFLRAR